MTLSNNPSSWASLFPGSEPHQPSILDSAPSTNSEKVSDDGKASSQKHRRKTNTPDTKGKNAKLTKRNENRQQNGKSYRKKNNGDSNENTRYQRDRRSPYQKATGRHRQNNKEVGQLVDLIADDDGNGEWQLTGKAKKMVKQTQQKQAKMQQKRQRQSPSVDAKKAAKQDTSTKKENKKAAKKGQISTSAQHIEAESLTPNETTTTQEISTKEPLNDAVSEGSQQPQSPKSSNKKRKKAPKRESLLTENVSVHIPAAAVLDHSRPSEIKTPVGLRNMNNTCFVNSIIQPIIHLPHFQELLSELYAKRLNPERYPLFYAFWNLMEQMKKVKSKTVFTCITPDELVTVLSEKQNTMRLGGEQNDAQEFFFTVLELLHKELLPVLSSDSSEQDDSFQVEDDGWEEVGKGNKSSVVQEVSFTPSSISLLFSGTMRSMVRKRNQKASLTLQPFYCIHLPIDHALTIKDCFKALTSKEALYSGISQQITFEDLPPVLILHLKRFSYNPRTGEATKIGRHVSFDENLYIDESILSKSKLSLNSKQRNYTLHSATMHHGSEIGNGHYSSMVRFANDTWYNFDDENISLKTTAECLKCSSYLLVYIRGD
mmetsp:Transcript_3505/g.13400  ORF Transcript_3505/g.13400 Transcript_3505/m.13400 type:complete len:600 (-) Transcript_3505:45-1844(-)